MEMLQLQLFGVPVVAYAGRPITFRSRRALALLIYLAVENRFHGRDQLAALLWPDAEQTHSRMLLRSAIALLRNGLAAVGFDSDQVLVLEQDRLRLNRDVIELDLDALERAEQPLERSVGRDAPADEGLRQAIAAYRGDFLGSFVLGDAPNFDEWATVQRERCHWRMHQIFDQLTHEYCEKHNWHAAIEVATRWIDHDPLHEAAHARLIECHTKVGDRTAALRAYERCRAVFERELGVAPSSETAALVAYHSSEALPKQPLQLLKAEDATTTIVQQLQTAFMQMQEGRTHVVVIKGIRTTNVTSPAIFACWAKQQNADLIYGRTFDLGGRVPYQTISDALRERLEHERAPDDLLPDVWLSELSHLVPNLRDRYPDLAMPPADNATSPMRLYEAVFQLTSALAQQRSLIWLVEDMQHADEASLDLLHYLVRRWNAEGVSALLVATADTTLPIGNRYRTPVFSRWIAQISGNMPVTLFASPAGQMVLSRHPHALAA